MTTAKTVYDWITSLPDEAEVWIDGERLVTSEGYALIVGPRVSMGGTLPSTGCARPTFLGKAVDPS